MKMYSILTTPLEQEKDFFSMTKRKLEKIFLK